jgi:L-threonylcarbamoyladenylate synthase
VLTLAEGTPRLLRPGKVTLEELQSVLGEVALDPAVLSKLKEGQKAASPGMKYKHYAPRANVILLKCSDDEFINYVNRNSGGGVAALCCDEDTEKLNAKYISLGKRNDYEAHAHRLFDSLRRIDGYGDIHTVYTRLPSTDGVGLAVYNRLIRAAGFEVIDLEKS